MSDQAYAEIRRMIIRLDLAPGDVLHEDELQRRIGLGRTPIREALQHLVRDQLVRVVPRRGVFVTEIDVAELPLLYETRAMLEPYAARLAAHRGTAEHWNAMGATLADAEGATPARLLDIDRTCHELIWSAAANRYLMDTLDMLYAHSDRLWHRYLSGVADMRDAVEEHDAILTALRAGRGARAARLVEAHVRSFDAQVRAAAD